MIHGMAETSPHPFRVADVQADLFLFWHVLSAPAQISSSGAEYSN